MVEPMLELVDTQEVQQLHQFQLLLIVEVLMVEQFTFMGATNDKTNGKNT
jgi:hypothetical protein